MDAAEKTDLVVAHGTPPAKITRAPLTVWAHEKIRLQRGRVVVKPNIGWDRTPEYAANTNPGGGHRCETLF